MSSHRDADRRKFLTDAALAGARLNRADPAKVIGSQEVPGPRYSPVQMFGSGSGRRRQWLLEGRPPLHLDGH